MPRHPPQLPFEIIIDILSRLPVKHLIQFKCVCRTWQYLISSDPEFAKLHLERVLQVTNVHLHRLLLSADPFQSVDMEAYCDADDNFLIREHRFPVRNPEDDDFEFVGSCNGLISAVFGSDHEITVWNPSTGESRKLPAPTSSTEDKLFYGFGYDSKLDDYKIVRGASSASCNEVQMEVFNLKGNRWRAIQNLHCNVRFQGSAIALNGILHWLVDQLNEGLMIVSLDLAEEKFLEMVVLPDYVTENWGTELKVLGDSLSVCSSSHTTNFEAWTVKGYGSKASWLKLFSFNSDPLPGCKYWLNVLWVAKNGNVLLNYEGLEIIVYNPKEQTLKQFNVPNNWHWFEAITYIESLVSPNAGNGSVAAADDQGL
ncbi:ubiquitin-protein ligase, putative [Ricinus communis]|uniref:Ubiquitin-protein ligase, putative n=1 Tax=Ricinus communis TaxID=3988 RepID=B9S324_RICCO|nr:ubiquitin-protein ligase, putative [Ricinus communis]|eukprot:XP_025013330.1 F-box/kelch-repeat protein At3g06240-like [Ricinus communis]